MVSLVNIQVPILLGDVVNVVAKFTQETMREGRTFMEEMYTPSIKLVKYYVVQVCYSSYKVVMVVTRQIESH